ncbi:unnamed protein product [Echinostoma caproni]|uniref:Fibronectin type-III domain-containing protein n=1 Tax=Echinostoma caproni TaxID=27848 RepID=A0A183A505_9TREM|nr:unnamed protein product [Echinostoma caproni]
MLTNPSSYPCEIASTLCGQAYRVHYTDRPHLELPFWDTSIMDVNEATKSGGKDEQNHSRMSAGQGQVAAGGLSAPGHLFLLTHLTADTTYYIRVSAVNGKGEGPPSDISVVIVRPGCESGYLF